MPPSACPTASDEDGAREGDTSRFPSRRQFVASLGIGTVGSAAGCVAPVPQEVSEGPNVLFLMADDHTAQAFGSYGSRLAAHAPTGQIDRLAREGARLENCFCTNALCAPSRASILTGQYSHENGVYGHMDGYWRLDRGHPNVAKELRSAGYRTGLIGKWHLKSDPAGFDHWNRLLGQGDYRNPRLKSGGVFFPSTERHDGFSTDVITDLTIDWLEQRRANPRPFFLMTQFKACHQPFGYPDRYADLLSDVRLPEPSTLFEDKSHRSPGSREYGLTLGGDMAERLLKDDFGDWQPDPPLSELSKRERRRRAYQRFVTRYLRSVAALNDNVGRILDFLDESGLAEDTVVIYTSDQGYFLGEHNYVDKRWMFEEAIRMPFLIRHPGEIDPGTVVDDLCLNVDFAPTFLDYAGVDTPDYMQGRSFRSTLQGRTPEDWRDAVYYRFWQHSERGDRPAHYGLRTERYKLIFYYGLPLDLPLSAEPTTPGIELYDLAEDPHETNNVYGDPEYADVAERLKRRLLEKKAELGDTDEAYPRLLERREEVW